MLVPLMAAGAVAIGVLLLALALFNPFKSEQDQRLEQLQGFVTGAGRAQFTRSAPGQASAIGTRVLEISEKVAKDRKSAANTMALLQRADLSMTAGEWLLLRAGVAAALTAVAWLFTNGALWLVVGFVLGFFLPQLVLRFLAKRRAAKFERQLPDVLFLIATGLTSGFGLSQSMEGVVKDAPEPVSTELSRAQAETRLGTDLTDALDRVANRMGSVTMHWTVMAMRIQAEVGGNLAETLRSTAATLRDREALARQVLTLSAEGRLSARILLGLPICLFLYMLMVNREYISLLWTTGMGMVMAVAAVVMMGLGVVWMNKVVKVEV